MLGFVRVARQLSRVDRSPDGMVGDNNTNEYVGVKAQLVV